MNVSVEVDFDAYLENSNLFKKQEFYNAFELHINEGIIPKIIMDDKILK